MKEVDFLSTIINYPLANEEFLKFFKTRMVETPKNVDQLRELIYSFIKARGFRVHIDFLTLSGSQRVIVELYLMGEFVSAYEKINNQNEIFDAIFNDAFEEIEKWKQEVSENKSNLKVLQE